MGQELARLFITLLATAIIGRQAVRATPGSRRRQVWMLASAAFLLFALANVLNVLRIGNAALLTVMIAVGLTLIAGGVFSMVLAFRDGEFRDKPRSLSVPPPTERSGREERAQGGKPQ